MAACGGIGFNGSKALNVAARNSFRLDSRKKPRSFDRGEPVDKEGQPFFVDWNEKHSEGRFSMFRTNASREFQPEDLVPQDHLLRKLTKPLIADKCRPLYCEDNGRPCIDPVMLFKMLPWLVTCSEFAPKDD